MFPLIGYWSKCLEYVKWCGYIIDAVDVFQFFSSPSSHATYFNRDVQSMGRNPMQVSLHIPNHRRYESFLLPLLSAQLSTTMLGNIQRTISIHFLEPWNPSAEKIPSTAIKLQPRQRRNLPGIRRQMLRAAGISEEGMDPSMHPEKMHKSRQHESA